MKTKSPFATKTARHAAAKTLATALEAVGLLATLEMEHEPYHEREVNWRVEFGDYYVWGYFSATTSDGLLCHWNTRGKAVFPKTFGCVINGTVNPYHFGKATAYYATLQDLIGGILDGLKALQVCEVTP